MRIERFGHAALEVSDLTAAEAWYRRLLGCEVVDRYPEDDEVMLGVGRSDHLLLHQSGSGGLNHVAFQLVEGHRELVSVRRRLAEQGVAFQEEDHDGDLAVYFRDPDGNLLEVYAAPGSTPRFATPAERFAAARRFLDANARPVDRAIFQHRFEGAPADRVHAALAAHRNDDGGFGQALEPDVRAAASQPIHTLTGLELLREAGIRAPDVADGCCRFLASVAGTDCALPALLPGALDHPAAAHWQGDFALQPNLFWTFGLVAALVWHGAGHEWCRRARAACLEALSDVETDEVHRLLYLFRFAETVLEGRHRQQELGRRRAALEQADLFVRQTPVDRYGLTPLHFVPFPESPSRICFEMPLIDAHLGDLLEAQQGDGGWPIRFEPPSEGARIEWRGRWTLEALTVLHAHGRLA